jgi:hypothetical protein
MVKANMFANTGTLRGIGGRGADDKAESPEMALARGEFDKLFGW